MAVKAPGKGEAAYLAFVAWLTAYERIRNKQGSRGQILTFRLKPSEPFEVFFRPSCQGAGRERVRRPASRSLNSSLLSSEFGTNKAVEANCVWDTTVDTPTPYHRPGP